MLTYTPPHEQELPPATEKPWMLLLLCLVWLIPGITGREPLKPDEIIIVDIVRSWFDGGGLSLPMTANEAWLERAPLFYWAAAGFAWFVQLLGLSLTDGARLATGVFSAAALWGTGLAARELIGRRHGRSAVLILIGCAGLLMPGHTINGDIAVFAGWCWAIYALALARRMPLASGPILGGAMAVCGTAGSLAEPVTLLLLACTLVGFRDWRQYRYGLAILIAMAIATPLIAAWPLALYHRSPDSYALWFSTYSLGAFGGFQHLQALHPFGYYLELLPWFAWPAWFLAGATLWMQRDRLIQPKFQLPLVAGLLSLVCMVLSNSGRAGFALLLLPPLALIGSAGLDVLRRGASSFVNWFGVMTFGILAIFLWASWSAIHLGLPARFSASILSHAPSYRPTFNLFAVGVGVLLTLAWLWAVSRRRPVGRQAVTNWAAGITLCWGLAIVVAADWVNATSSYRDFSQLIKPQLPRDRCLASQNLQPSQRAVLHYYLGISTERVEIAKAKPCDWLLVQADEFNLPPPNGWSLSWQGARPGDQRERYLLYRRQTHANKSEDNAKLLHK